MTPAITRNKCAAMRTYHVFLFRDGDVRLLVKGSEENEQYRRIKAAWLEHSVRNWTVSAWNGSDALGAVLLQECGYPVTDDSAYKANKLRLVWP
jgi:hypothetical protein